MMEQLIVSRQMSKGKRMFNVVIRSYLVLLCLFITISESIANRFGVLFYLAAIGFVLSLILLLYVTLWLPGPLLLIDSLGITSSQAGQARIKIEWANVSKVNIGMNYFVFDLGGKRQQNIDLESLTYKEIKAIKSKVIELCEYNNIPYLND